ncbi:MAG: amidohydrolase family protein [Gammaproteobacteria bacterium]|nr:amidohydrolase family protein [Gammaproteobacteria bacterium]
MLDLVIRNGKIVDGSGMPSFIGDIGIRDGRIARVGSVTEQANQEIDAAGKVVAPGFIDPHTHFDAQLLWDGAAKPAIEHGVTTIVPGNCSLSLAPLEAEHRMRLVGMFNQIEEMPPEGVRGRRRMELGDVRRIRGKDQKGSDDQRRPPRRSQRPAPVGDGRGVPVPCY